jgi:hypothetical protein
MVLMLTISISHVKIWRDVVARVDTTSIEIHDESRPEAHDFSRGRKAVLATETFIKHRPTRSIL